MTETRPDKSLEGRLREWLQQEGHPLEFRTASEFARARFAISQGQYVVDPITGKPRDVDVVADANVDSGAHLVRFSYVIECKWSADKPWVMFLGQRGIAPSACVAQTLGSELGVTAQ